MDKNVSKPRFYARAAALKPGNVARMRMYVIIDRTTGELVRSDSGQVIELPGGSWTKNKVADLNYRDSMGWEQS